MKGSINGMEINYYNKEAETMPREKMQKLQSERLREMIGRVYNNTPHYREKMDEMRENGIEPFGVRKFDRQDLARTLNEKYSNEDKDELKQLRSELYTIIDELNDYELVNFNNCDIDYDNYK